MLDPKNVVTITGNLVADPELVADGKILKLTIAVNYAASSKDGNTTGFFDVTFFKRDGDQGSDFVFSQVTKGNFKKGSQLAIVGRLSQDRWETDGQKRSRVVVIAEAISYAGVKSDTAENSDAPAAAPSKSLPVF